jgi:hypothetical protein
LYFFLSVHTPFSGWSCFVSRTGAGKRGGSVVICSCKLSHERLLSSLTFWLLWLCDHGKAQAAPI